MGFPEPTKPSLLEYVYNFLTSRAVCWAALFCLSGGLLCSWGVARSVNWAIFVGGTMMAPYSLAALIFLSVMLGVFLFVLCFISLGNLRALLKRKLR